MLVAYYNYDLEQIGASPTAAALGSSFGTIFRTGPFDKLTFVQKVGMNIEKDVKKDFVFGDMGPVEAAWRRSSLYPFAAIKSFLLMSPNKILGNEKPVYLINLLRTAITPIERTRAAIKIKT